ncbi:MAG: hypothetical protein KDD11_11110, partial [Acidobacteria bacterium]|nr:hypothetical protein [Acidobacteriota bacterium]
MGGFDSDRRRGWRGGLLHPLPWLLAQALVLVWRCAATGRLVAERVPDSGGYLSLAKLSLSSDRWLETVLGATRTYGYPLFLKVLGWGSPKLEAVPAAQLVGYLLALLLFWHGFHRYSGRPWLAFWAVTPLFYADVLSSVARIQADFLAASAALASLGLLLWLARSPRSPVLWGALTVAVVFSYHVRPAYLYLLALIPVLGLVLRWLLPEERRLRWRWGLGLGLAMALPFLAYSSLRWEVLGHFGLVSFGGYNLAGVATPLLDETLIADLPEGQRRLARVILEYRGELGLDRVTWETPLRRWQSQYNRSIWLAAVPAARQEVRRIGPEPETTEEVRLRREVLLKRKARADGRQLTADERAELREERQRRRMLREARRTDRTDEAAALNRNLSELSRSILERRPLLYAKWVLGGFGTGTGKAWKSRWVHWPGSALLLLGAAAGGLHLRYRRRPEEDPPPDRAALPGRLRWTWRSAAMAVVAAGYFAVGLGLVVLVEVPFDRYMVALTLLLPGALLTA